MTLTSCVVLAVYGLRMLVKVSSVADADNRWDVHRAIETGQPMTSWRVS